MPEAPALEMDVVAVCDQVGTEDLRALYDTLYWHLYAVADEYKLSFTDLWDRLNRLFKAPAFPSDPRQKLSEWQEWVEMTAVER